MNSGIYCITNLINGKIYVGSAKNLIRRENNHKSKLKLNCHVNKKLQNSYNKHGLSSFMWMTLEHCEIKYLLTREQFYMDILNPFDFGYNLLRIAGSPLGRKLSDETKRKMSVAKQNMSEETKKRMSESGKRRNSISEETRQRMCSASKGHERNAVKTFRIFSPTGDLIEVTNLKKFCRENNLDNGTMYGVINGKRQSHKGYTQVKTHYYLS